MVIIYLIPPPKPPPTAAPMSPSLDASLGYFSWTCRNEKISFEHFQ